MTQPVWQMAETALAVMEPAPHLLGTSTQELIDQRIEARCACLRLIEALGQLGPNGRDYIGLPDKMKADRRIHAARIALIDALANALMDEGLAIQERGR